MFSPSQLVFGLGLLSTYAMAIGYDNPDFVFACATAELDTPLYRICEYVYSKNRVNSFHPSSIEEFVIDNDIMTDNSDLSSSKEVHKRKNEFIRFGRSIGVEEAAPASGEAFKPHEAKRKNEFIRFGRSTGGLKSLDAKRKNEFIRFGRSASLDSDNYSPEVMDTKLSAMLLPQKPLGAKRKNEFIRFG